MSNRFTEIPLESLLAPSEIERARMIYAAYGDSSLNPFESVLRGEFPRLSRSQAYAVEYWLMLESAKPRRGKPKSAAKAGHKPDNWGK